MWARGFGCLFVLVACVPGKSPIADETTASGTTSASSSEASGSSFSSTPTSSGPGESSSGADMPVAGEWVGTYDAGFGYAIFYPCGTDEEWLIIGSIYGYELCRQAPLWLRISGTVQEDPEDYPGRTVITVESYAGPCLAGSCEDGPTEFCDTFDTLCLTETGECNPVFQNCPEGEKCAPGPTEAVCVPLDPNPVAIGEPCMRDPEDFGDTCIAGSLCQVADPQVGDGECVPTCTGTYSEPVCEDPDLVCMRGSSYAYCLSPCDPLLGDCPDTHTCIYGGYESEVFVCYETAKADQGLNEPCEFLTDCAEGLLCVNNVSVPCGPDEIGCCAALCDLGEPTCDALNTECQAWWSGPLEGHENLGLCIFPEP